MGIDWDSGDLYSGPSSAIDSLSKSFHSSVPQFPHLQRMANSASLLTEITEIDINQKLKVLQHFFPIFK